MRISDWSSDVCSSDLTLGISATATNLGLMVLVGIVAVAAFEAVGSILVIAMFICPAGAARMLTDRLAAQVRLSLLFAALSSIGGYVMAAFGPFWIAIGRAEGRERVCPVG